MEELVVKSHVCKTCKNVFIMDEAHENWFTERGLQIPTHCAVCINQRKSKILTTEAKNEN